MARSTKSLKRQSKRQEPAAGSVLVRLVVSLLVLGAVALVVSKVKVGDRTIYEHGHALVNWDAVSEGAAAATRMVQRELEQSSSTQPSSAPVKVVALGDNAPAEHLDDADRAALDSLLPR